MTIDRTKWWVIYDDRGVAIALVPKYDQSPPARFQRQLVTKSVRLSDLPEYDQEQLIKIFRERRTGTGQRQRNGGHGYSGGDGFTDL